MVRTAPPTLVRPTYPRFTSEIVAHLTQPCPSCVPTAQLQVNSFGSSLDTTMWLVSTSASNPSEANQADKVSTSSNQLKLSIAPCTTTSSCSGKNFSAGAVFTQSSSFGYGIYTAFFKAPATNGFTAQFSVCRLFLTRSSQSSLTRDVCVLIAE